jgi:hypothetical protein
MANEFKKTVGAQVWKKDALKWIDKFDKERKKDTQSVFYGRDAIEEILKDQTVTGISFFFARKPNQEGKDYDDLVLVGRREDGSLIWNDNPPTATLNSATGSNAYENGISCPPYCS